MFYHRDVLVFSLRGRKVTKFPKAFRWKRGPKDSLYGKQTHAGTEESKSMKISPTQRKGFHGSIL